jgi:hypothetical protein
MRIHPGAAATIALLLQRGAKDDEIDGVIDLMSRMENTKAPGKEDLYSTQLADFDRAIQIYRRQKNPLVSSRGKYLD